MKKTFVRKIVNNQQYQILALPGTDLFKIEMVNLYGANIERVFNRATGKNVYGLSHFIEHLGFRAPKDFTTEELMKLIKSEGSYNASTDHSRINYWFKTVTERMNIAIKLVCNYALNDLTKISQDEFELEKKVVFNEAKRYADDDQTMFYFNMTPTMCNYHSEDNVIGIPETIETFTLEDAITLKRIMMDYGEMTVNITYDPEKTKEADIIKRVSGELSHFKTPKRDGDYSKLIKDLDLFNPMLTNPSEGDHLISNESEQAMTGLLLDVIDDIPVIRVANTYISHYAETSLTDIIREKNGLTYSISFYEKSINYKPYTMFACDVSKGDEDKLIELFKDSIAQSVEAFTEEKHEELMDIVKMKRVLANLNLGSYDNLFWTGLWYPKYVEAYKDQFALDIDETYKLIDDYSVTFEAMKTYLDRLNEYVQNEKWTKTHN